MLQVNAPLPRRPRADLALQNVCLGYGGKVAVRDITGQFAQGSMTAIVGPNGGGKSTLLKGLLGLLRPLHGRIESRHARAALGYLAQASEVELQFPVQVEDFVAMGLWAQVGGTRAVTRAMAQHVRAAIEAVGLKGMELRWIGELSGGQFQRMRFARLLVQDAPVVLLDEPFAGVDEPTMAALLQLLNGWHACGKTVIAVLHDSEMVRAHFPQTLALAGSVQAWGDTEGVLDLLAWRYP